MKTIVFIALASALAYVVLANKKDDQLREFTVDSKRNNVNAYFSQMVFG